MKQKKKKNLDYFDTHRDRENGRERENQTTWTTIGKCG